MADEGAFTAKLRSDFFVGVIFSAAGSGNNSAADDLTEGASVGSPTPEGFSGILCADCLDLVTGFTSDREGISPLRVRITYCIAGGWLGGARCVGLGGDENDFFVCSVCQK